MSAAYGAGQTASALVRVIETPDGAYAAVQVDVDGTGNGAHWVTIAELDGIHLGDTVNVILDASLPAGTSIPIVGNFGITGDFNGDGNADLLWRNDNGSTSIWLLNGGQVLASPTIGSAGNEWHIVGIGDFNGDSHSDVIWRSDNGSNSIWELNGGQILAQPSLGTVGDRLAYRRHR